MNETGTCLRCRNKVDLSGVRFGYAPLDASSVLSCELCGLHMLITEGRALRELTDTENQTIRSKYRWSL